MIKRKTVFEQVPLAVARRIAAEELKQKEAGLKKSGSNRKSDGRTTAAVVAGAGASL